MKKSFPLPDRKTLEVALDDSAAIGKIQAATPTMGDLMRQFPDAPVVTLPNGQLEIRVTDVDPQKAKRKLRTMNEMFRKRSRLLCDHGQAMHARHSEVQMRDADGRLRYVRE